MAKNELEKALKKSKAKKAKMPKSAPARNSMVQGKSTSTKINDASTKKIAIRKPKETKAPRAKKAEAYKISASEQRQLTKLRRSAAAKQRRIRQNYGIEVQRPMHGRSFENSQDFQLFTDRLREFTSRSSNRFIKLGTGDNQFSIPKEEYDQVMQAYKYAQQQRAEYYQGVNKKRLIIGGEEQADTVEDYARRSRQTPGDTYYDMLNPLQFEPKTIKNKEQWERIASRIQRQSTPEYWEKRTQTMYDNYIMSIMRLQEKTGFYAQDLIDDIRELTPQEFLQMYYQSQADFESVFFNTPEDLKIVEDIQQVFKNVRLDIINVRARRDR
jgi:hypothetical protein